MIRFIVTILFFPFVLGCRSLIVQPMAQSGYTGLPTAKVTLKVVDESGKPMSGLRIITSVIDHHTMLESPVYKGFITNYTDSQGVFVDTVRDCTGQYGRSIHDVSGYYDGFAGYTFFKTATNRHWLPWNPTLEIVLKPIVNPVPMFAHKIETHIKTAGKKYGYDLMVGDWVALEGKGENADVFFEVTGYAKGVTNNDSKLIVSFPNALDGLQTFASDKSAFKSPREAPLEGYKEKLELRRVRKPGQLSPEWIDDTKKQGNYFFRVRTVLDETGKIKSALYGKIYGNFEFGGSVDGCFLRTKAYYLNPESNSRNMEFDPKRNLFGKLPSLEQVREP